MASDSVPRLLYARLLAQAFILFVVGFSGQLPAVVQEAMQPEKIGLWLKD